MARTDSPRASGPRSPPSNCQAADSQSVGVGRRIRKPQTGQPADAEQALEAASAGHRVPYIQSTHPRQNAAEAHADLEQRRTMSAIPFNPLLFCATERVSVLDHPTRFRENASSVRAGRAVPTTCPFGRRPGPLP
jgi:hypothetical protein